MAQEENPQEYMVEVVCPTCPWSQKEIHPLLEKLLTVQDLVEAGAPIGRHELSDYEWRMLPIIKANQERIFKEKEERKKRKG